MVSGQELGQQSQNEEVHIIGWGIFDGKGLVNDPFMVKNEHASKPIKDIFFTLLEMGGVSDHFFFLFREITFEVTLNIKEKTWEISPKNGDTETVVNEFEKALEQHMNKIGKAGATTQRFKVGGNRKST